MDQGLAGCFYIERLRLASVGFFVVWKTNAINAPRNAAKKFPSYFAAFFLVGFAFAIFFAALASAISENTFSIRRI